MGGAGNEAVDAVRRECGELVLSRRPAGLLPFAGGDDDQRLGADAFQCFGALQGVRSRGDVVAEASCFARAVTDDASDTESGE